MSKFKREQNGIYDVVVIGAGPAGALSAYLLAREKKSVLLLDKLSFPRQKVCGSCFNELSLSLLEKYGLLHLMEKAVSLQKFCLKTSGKQIEVPIMRSSALSRDAFDAALVREAVREGSSFLPGTRAKLIKSPYVHSLKLNNSEGETTINAKIILVADGIGGDFLRSAETFKTKISKNSRIGICAAVGEFPDFYQLGTIYMAASKHGYVGLTVLENKKLNVASALDLSFLRQMETPARAVFSILRENAFPFLYSWEMSEWLGTPALTRSKNVFSSERLFVLGDAASYVEPFTGEGIGWAFFSAVKVVPLVLRALQKWENRLSQEWNNFYLNEMARRQLPCKIISKILRKQVAIKISAYLLSRRPEIAHAFTGADTHSIQGGI